MSALLHTLGIILLLTSICSAVECLWWTRRPSIKNIFFNYFVAMISLSALQGLQIILNPFWTWLRSYAFFPIYFAQLSTPAKWAAATATLFTWDFFQYWAHRAQHRFPFLWNFHRLHHSDRDVSGSTSIRNHLFNHVANLVCISIPMTLLFPTTPMPTWTVYVFFWCYGYFNHTRLRIHLGPLTPVFSGPLFHHVHHGIAKAHHDKNFAAFFPILDILFGTYYKPAKNEIIETGIDDALAPNSLAHATIEPFAAFWSAKSPGAPATVPIDSVPTATAARAVP